MAPVAPHWASAALRSPNNRGPRRVGILVSGISYRPPISAGAWEQGGAVASASGTGLARGCSGECVAPLGAAGSKAFRRVPRFAPAAVAANKSLKPTPHRRCVQRSRRAVYRRFPTVALRRGLALVLGLMLLDALVDAIFSSTGLPARISRSFVAVAMLLGGLSFFGLAVLMIVVAADKRAFTMVLFAGLFFALSAGSFWLTYRAAREQSITRRRR